MNLASEEAKDAECHSIRGIVADKKAFVDEDPSEDQIDVFNVGATIEAESYEICGYESFADRDWGKETSGLRSHSLFIRLA